MQFFTAGDVLARSTEAPVGDPITVSLDDTIQDALKLMLSHDFDQLPVLYKGEVEGAVTYKQVAKYVKSVDEPQVADTSIKITLESDPVFVESNHDLFELFETLAEESFVLIGSRDELQGILTRYDVFYFLKYQVDPFLKIGEIENALRQLFRDNFDNLDTRIEAAFGERAANDSRYELPTSVEYFSFSEYRVFMMKHIDELPDRLSNDREMVSELLDDVNETRNALFHFRRQVDDVDRDQLDLAHNYFTGIANTTA